VAFWTTHFHSSLPGKMSAAGDDCDPDVDHNGPIRPKKKKKPAPKRKPAAPPVSSESVVQIVTGGGLYSQLVRFESQAVLDAMRDDGFKKLVKAIGAPPGTPLQVGGVFASFLPCLF